ncbi:MAG: hypothetical protein QF440_04520 [Candidatus Thalassarchaeaceae archaeon]|jgi:hypothetical protein|nr:hypothetical protein [Candidatus Thalassarchaeaceae archaeon]
MVGEKDPVIRSLVLEKGFINAHKSGDLVWWPKNGEIAIAHLHEGASIILGIGENDQNITHVAVGGVDGSVTLLSLPKLDYIDSWCPHKSPVTALFLEKHSGNQFRFITADSQGNVNLIGYQLPRTGVKILNLGRRITSISANREQLIVMSGWQRMVFNRKGSTITNNRKNISRRMIQTKLPLINRSPRQAKV